MARAVALAAALAASLLAVSGAGGAPAQTPTRGGTLVIGWGNEPPCLNVLIQRCNPPVPLMRWISAAIFETPYEIVGGSYRPKLATATYTTRRPFTLTYRIRPEARWSDGVPVTARDFVFTLRAMRELNSTAKEAHGVIRSIRIVDARTLRVVLRPRFGGWRGLFDYVLPEHALRDADLAKVWDDRIDDPKSGRPIGSGPFLVERFERGHELVLRRNRNYWGPHPAYLDRLVLRFTSPSESADGLREGELDVATGFGEEGAFGALRGDPRFEVKAVEAFGLEHFVLRLGQGGHPALRSKLVRRAFAYGVDRVALARQIYGGTYASARPLDSIVLTAHSPHYVPNWSGYRYRPAQARRLLEQAGCRRGGDGIYSCASERLSLRAITGSGTPYRERVLELVESQLRRAGIELRSSYVPGLTFFGPGGILRTGQFDVVLFNLTYNPESTGLGTAYGCGGSSNWGGYCQRLVTADLDQADRILDDARRARALNRADRRIAKDVPVLPLFQRVDVAAQTADLHNYRLHSIFPFRDAENWWLDR